MNPNQTSAAELARKCYDPEAFRMIPKEAIVHKYFTDEPEYAASWDLFVTKSGRIFFPLCAELYYPMMTRLYEYLPEQDKFRLCFKIEDVTFQQDRAIRTSKIHTSIAEINDGRLIMTTHTTARSPYHPDWMPHAYHAHPWEGYQGSHILIYDYINDKVEDKGIPVPFESIYGAKYDSRHNCLYFTGYIKGHLYRYDLDTNRITDYGKVTEFGSFRICEGPDGHFYSSSRSGNFYRINTDTQQIEELGIEFPNNNGKYSTYHRIISYSAILQDKLYLQVTFDTGLWCYDPKHNTLEYAGDLRPVNMGNYVPKEDPGSYTQWIFGLAADDEGCLWYGYGLGGLHLCRYDVLRGTKPEQFGIIGTQERGIETAAELLYRDNKLYCGNTNHLLDGPGVAVIDIPKLLDAKKNNRKGDICGDALFYLTIARNADQPTFAFRPADGFIPVPLDSFYPYDSLEADMQSYIDDEISSSGYQEVMNANPVSFCAKKLEGILLWRLLSIELSQVHYLYWDDDHTLMAQTGTKDGQKLLLTLKDGVITDQKELEEFTKDTIPGHLLGLEYPSYPGRQYKAVPHAVAPWKDGSYLVGTLDGMLAVVRPDGSVFSLGTAAQNGPIHQICVNSDCTKAYGVAGDAQDLGNIFAYDDTRGLRWEGTVYREKLEEGITLSADRLYRIALSPDESTLAVGSVDRMGGIYLYTLK